MIDAADPGFDRSTFADVLGAVDQISDAAFAPYGIDTESIRGVRQRFAEWQKELRQG